MLIEFSVANYRCFRERVTLSLEAEPRISERDKSVDERNVARTADGDLLRVAGIYGANASGKSNLLGAMRVLRTIVLDSVREGQAGDRLPVDPFRLDVDTRDAPSELEVVFLHDGIQFRYGLRATQERVEREWLFTRAVAEEQEERWFERERDVYEVGLGWQHDPSLEQKTRIDVLHLSVAAAFNHPQALRVLGWFQRLRLINGLEATDIAMHTAKLLGEPEHGRAIRELVRQLDFGIDDLQVVMPDRNAIDSMKRDFPVKSLPKGFWDELVKKLPPRVLAIRRGVEFDLLRDESAGTAKAVELAGPLIEALANGDVVVIDEFDARLHTLLAKQLVELFQDPLTNRHDAQLVFASHDTNLLARTLLRRDQLWFVEKSRKTQASDLYSLAELRLDAGKGVRNDARYEADYLQGRYGAIPFFGNLEALVGEVLGEGE